MPFTFECPACGRQMNAADSARGAAGKCRFCGAPIIAPSGPGRRATLNVTGQTTSMLAPGKIDLGSIVTEAWDLFKVHWGSLAAAHFITFILTLLVMMPILVPIFIHRFREFTEARVPYSHIPSPHGIGLLFACLAVFLQPLSAGPLHVATRMVTHGEADLSLLLTPFKRCGALLQFSLIYNLPIIALQFIQYVFSLSTQPLTVALLGLTTICMWALEVAFVAGLRPGMMEIIDKGADGLSAAILSWEFTKGHRWIILGTSIVMSLLASIGSAVCCGVIIFTIGFETLGQVLVYRQLRGLRGQPGS